MTTQNFEELKLEMAFKKKLLFSIKLIIQIVLELYLNKNISWLKIVFSYFL